MQFFTAKIEWNPLNLCMQCEPAFLDAMKKFCMWDWWNGNVKRWTTWKLSMDKGIVVVVLNPTLVKKEETSASITCSKISSHGDLKAHIAFSNVMVSWNNWRDPIAFKHVTWAWIFQCSADRLHVSRIITCSKIASHGGLLGHIACPNVIFYCKVWMEHITFEHATWACMSPCDANILHVITTKHLAHVIITSKYMN